MLRVTLMLSFLVVLVADAKPVREEKKSETTSLDGVWVCTAFEKGEKNQVPEMVGKFKITFAGDKMTLQSPNRGELTAKFVLDLSKKPGHIDFTAKLEERENTGHGLIVRDGDMLTLCIDNRPDSPRPTELKAGGSTALITLKLQR